MARLRMRGKWVGEYEMPKDGDLPRHMVSFTLVLKDAWFGIFSGTVQDDPQAGMPERGTVRGKITGMEVEFTKRMPVAYVRTATRPTRLSASVEQYGIPRQAGAVEHPPIVYRGRYLPDQDSIAGEWRIPAHELVAPDSGFLFRFKASAGSFWMRRQCADV